MEAAHLNISSLVATFNEKTRSSQSSNAPPVHACYKHICQRNKHVQEQPTKQPNNSPTTKQLQQPNNHNNHNNQTRTKQPNKTKQENVICFSSPWTSS